MTVFHKKQLYFQTFVSRRGRKFPIRIDERKSLVKVSSNFVEIELHSCKNNDPTRVCGRLFCARARPDPNVSSIGPRGGPTLCVFLLTSCCVYPTWLGRAAMERKQHNNNNNNNNTIPSCRGPVPSSRPGQFG